MGKILIFAGTAEGRKLAEFLNENKKACYVSVATEYGKNLLPVGEYIESSSQRLTAKEMENLIERETISYVIDATHPFAVEVSENIKKACESKNKAYVRLLREKESLDYSDCVSVSSIKEAVEYLTHTEGRILVTTGSKDIKEYMKIAHYKERITARILPIPKIIKELNEIGFEGKNLICMQGPFQEELNYSILKQFQISYLVTKESGKAGGLKEKYAAAKRAGVKMILIGCPKEKEGYSLEQIKQYICSSSDHTRKQEITFVGIGMGTKETMTLEAWEACKQADVLIGARRMIKAAEELKKPTFSSYQIEEIKEYIKKHPEFINIAILVSGDVGFYSGTKKWIEELQEYSIRTINGISSVAYFCGKLGISWEQVKLVSLHGRKQNIIEAVKANEVVFSLIGNQNGVNQLCEKLISAGIEEVKISIGENLSYPMERISFGTPKEILNKKFDSLCAAVIENKNANKYIVTHGKKDEEFLRGSVPMTKSEIRSISLSKLELTNESVIYDIGAGTGSISVELAIQASNGMTYAVEKKKEAIHLIEQNKNHFGLENLQIIEGEAPEALEALPKPTHVFIGGSSGNLSQIIKICLEKNGNTRFVINVITLETVAEALECIKVFSMKETDIVSVSIAKSKEVGNYHMMMGQNPVYIISCQGGENESVS